MTSISYYENLIREKRKKTPFREFIRELGSWEVLNLYKRNGRVCRYPESDRIKVLDDKEYRNASSHSREYDATKSFFENLQDLIHIFPFEYVFRFDNNENSDFADGVFGAKNAYLSFIVGFNAENVAYSALCYNNVHNIFNSFLACINSSNVYMSGGINESHNIFYSRYITNSSNIWFSTNLIGCHECIGCDSLENQEYMIGNTQYTKETYAQKKSAILQDKKSFERNFEHIGTKKGRNLASTNVHGEYIVKSSNIENGAWVVNIHDSRNVVIANGANGSRDFYDGFDVGMNSERFYAVMGAGGVDAGARNLYCSMQITDSSFLYYSQYLQNCHHCLGCIGLKNKSYCILNTQYTKEEWEEKVCAIFASMEADGTLGDFFPASMNPFYFNDSAAYLFDPSFTKEEVKKEGYMWRDEPIRVDIPEGLEVVKRSELDRFQGWISHSELDSESSTSSQNQKKFLKPVQDDEHTVWYIDPDILRKVIQDEHGNIYRIVPMEYDFLMKHALPLPEIHWLERIKRAFH